MHTLSIYSFLVCVFNFLSNVLFLKTKQKAKFRTAVWWCRNQSCQVTRKHYLSATRKHPMASMEKSPLVPKQLIKMDWRHDKQLHLHPHYSILNLAVASDRAQCGFYPNWVLRKYFITIRQFADKLFWAKLHKEINFLIFEFHFIQYLRWTLFGCKEPNGCWERSAPACCWRGMIVTVLHM